MPRTDCLVWPLGHATSSISNLHVDVVRGKDYMIAKVQHVVSRGFDSPDLVGRTSSANMAVSTSNADNFGRLYQERSPNHSPRCGYLLFEEQCLKHSRYCSLIRLARDWSRS
jgi:hypothetical protein